MLKMVVAAALPLAAIAADATSRSWPVAGVVSQECVAAVAASPQLYAAATPGRPDALRSELRVRDSKGRDVPYAVRPQKTRRTEISKEWRNLKIVRVSESEGRLVVDAEFQVLPDSPAPSRFVALKIDTPLDNFEQTVEIVSGGERLGAGVFCDYSRFADVRVVEMPLDIPFRRAFSFTFAKPSSEAANAAFERTIRENGDGSLEAKSVRQSIVTRPFRIDSISVAIPRAIVSFRPAEPWEIRMPVQAATDAKTKKTAIETPAFGLPVRAVAVNATDRNFSRKVSVLRRIDTRWHPFASGRISSVNLPGEKDRRLEVAFGCETKDEAYRVEIENDDNPPLAFDGEPVALKVTPYDIVFIAEPGEKYSLSVVKGAERPRYDETILGYIDRVQDPVRLTADLPPLSEFLAECASKSLWSRLPTGWVVPAVSILVFAALGVLCLKLLKSAQCPAS